MDLRDGMGGYGLNSSSFVQGSVSGFCEHGINLRVP
jgi:hypothetical protein